MCHLKPLQTQLEVAKKLDKITFLKKNTDTVQVHVDYDFMILKDNNTEVFRAVLTNRTAIATYSRRHSNNTFRNFRTGSLYC